ncbi:MAG: hypothetical protein HRT57_12665 [Crocinitomicaceae bacterium]|nr:hypothetical protein [Crocinitomicaceae bacterium]
MSRRLKYIIGIGVILIGLTIFSKPIFKIFVNTDTVVNKIGCRLFEFNTISVKTDSDLNLNKAVIKINNRVVFKDGQQQDKIGQYYGGNILDIYYGDLLIAQVGHSKRNNWYCNDYIIEISMNENNFIVKHQIFGPDSERDNFQKRYIYQDLKSLVQIDYLNENGEVYNIEKKGGNTVYSK